MGIYILNRRMIVMQRRLRKSVESNRQVFIVRAMPAFGEFDDTLSMLWLCWRQLDGYPEAYAAARVHDACRWSDVRYGSKADITL